MRQSDCAFLLQHQALGKIFQLLLPSSEGPFVWLGTIPLLVRCFYDRKVRDAIANANFVSANHSEQQLAVDFFNCLSINHPAW